MDLSGEFCNLTASSQHIRQERPRPALRLTRTLWLKPSKQHMGPSQNRGSPQNGRLPVGFPYKSLGFLLRLVALCRVVLKGDQKKPPFGGSTSFGTYPYGELTDRVNSVKLLEIQASGFEMSGLEVE